MSNPVLIGTGFYANHADVAERIEFMRHWLNNTKPHNIVVIDNSEVGFIDASVFSGFRNVRIRRNLGHACWPISQTAKTPLLGWSLSWMIPALMAYSEGCDFVYKEQDCLAFGDWLPRIRHGAATIGRHHQMPCEQSLFYIRHDYILTFVRDYLSIPGHDAQIVTEDKFRRMMEQSFGAIQFHDLPGGRNRPLPNLAEPFYLQKITAEEMTKLKEAKLI